MKTTKYLLTTVFLMALSTLCSTAMAKDTIDPVKFVDQASAAGVAEIEEGKLALQKSTTPAVKTFAQEIINDHTAANKELAGIAQKKNLKVATEAELLTKAKAFILKQRDGQSFDEAYANNQVKAHKETIELFNKAAASPDVDLAAFAVATLPKLEHHLHAAETLAKAYEKK
jgi:putative membrane protein